MFLTEINDDNFEEAFFQAVQRFARSQKIGLDVFKITVETLYNTKISKTYTFLERSKDEACIQTDLFIKSLCDSANKLGLRNFKSELNTMSCFYSDLYLMSYLIKYKNKQIFLGISKITQR